jgi:hypothetical protein
MIGVYDIDRGFSQADDLSASNAQKLGGCRIAMDYTHSAIQVRHDDAAMTSAKAP